MQPTDLQKLNVSSCSLTEVLNFDKIAIKV